MRRRLPFLRTLIGLGLALFVSAGGFLLLGRVDRVVVAAGRLTGGSVAATSEIEGRVAEVLVRAGDSVEEGRVLARLETAALEAEIEQSESRLVSVEGALAALDAREQRLRTEDHPAALTRARRAIAQSELKHEGAERVLARMQELGGSGLVAELDTERLELERDLAALALEEARQSLDDLKTAQSAELLEASAERDRLTARHREESAALAEGRRQLAAAAIRAPAAGVVVGAELPELPGRVIAAGTEIARIANGPAARFEGRVPDGGRPFVASGQRVKVRLAGYPWLVHGSVPGQVAFVSDRRDGAEGFPVEVALTGPGGPGPLFEGMHGQARIVVEDAVSPWRLLLERLTPSRGP